MSNAVNQESNKAWSMNTTEEWLATVEEWDWKGVEADFYRKTGTCPNCLHEMSKDLSKMNFQFGTPLITGVSIRCNCNQPHPGRPENVPDGCGFGGKGFSMPSDE
jgi:hypothetical protein